GYGRAESRPSGSRTSRGARRASCEPRPSAQLESRVAVRGALPAERQVLLYADVMQQLTALARDVGTHVPGVRQRKQRARRQLCHVLRPRLARRSGGLDPRPAVVAQVAKAVGDPVSLELGAVGPVAE